MRGAAGIGPSRLRLDLLVDGDRGVQGDLAWSTTPDPPRTSDLLDAALGVVRKRRVHRVELATHMVLDVPAGNWTWLAVRTSRPRYVRAYRRVAPFTGEQRVLLALRSDERALHVFVLEGDLDAPAAHRPVSLYRTNMQAIAVPELVRRKTTDAYGYVLFEHLEPGGFLVCAPNAKPGTDAPHAARILLPKGMPMTEMPLTLVAAEQTERFELDVQASFEAKRGLPPKLFLRRIDGPVETLHPVPGLLRPGRHVAVVDLPVGRYSIEALPLGRFDIDGGRASVRVVSSGKNHRTVKLVESEQRVEVVLAGLPADALGVRVWPAREGQVDGRHLPLLFAGPSRWPAHHAEIPELDGLRRIIVQGRTRRWIAREAVRLRGRRVTVDLVPAGLLRITWFGKSNRGRPFVDGQVGRFSTHVGLGPYLLQRRSATVPALGATLVLPAGEARIVCSSSGGKRFWTRSCRISIAGATLEIGPSPK